MRKFLLLFFCSFFLGGIAHAQNITSIAGNGTYGYSGDGGPATMAQLEYIWHVVTDASGNAYFTDNANHRIRKVTPSGTISTYAGNGLPGFAGDGGQATAAQMSGPSGITIDAAGNIYFADATLQRVRKVNTSGVISTIAGTGVVGFLGDGAAATTARLSNPIGLFADANGNIFIADVGNNRVRKIDASGIITSVAGNGVAGFGGDGAAATAAKLSSPSSIAVDRYGNLYIGDLNNNRIRKVSTSGIITTIAGNGTPGYLGDGGPAILAEINKPLGVAVDAVGNVMISDQFNHRIRKVDDTGGMSTVAGSGIAGFSGDGGPATNAKLNQPFGIVLDTTGNMFISDWGNYRLRKINYNNYLPYFNSGDVDSFNLCENGIVTISTQLRVTDIDTGQILKWRLLSGPYHGSVTLPYSAPSTGGMVTPTAMNYSPFSGYSGFDTFVVRVDDGLTIDTITIYGRVKPNPNIGAITGSSIVCIGIPDSLHNIIPGGVWSADNTNATITAAGVVYGVRMGNDTIRYTLTLAGCMVSGYLPVVIYQTTDSIIGSPAVCIGSSISWIGIPAGGTWSSANSHAFVTGGVIAGIYPGVDTITYSVTNPCGTATYQKVITVNDMIAPSVYIVGNPGPFIVAGQSDTLTAIITGGSGLYDYQWQKNGADIPGATNSVYISSTLGNGDSISVVVNNGPCSAASFTWVYIVWVGAGVDLTSLPNSSFAVLPNPNKGVLNIQCQSRLDGNAAIKVTDIVGREVYSNTVFFENGRLQQPINVGDQLANGVYLLHLITGGGEKVERFVINR